MPNNIKNRLKIGSRVDEVRYCIRSDDREIDFNKIVPMPEIIKNTISGSIHIENGIIIKDPVTKIVPADSIKIMDLGNDLKKTIDGWYLRIHPFYSENEWELFRRPTLEELIEFKKIGSRTWYEWSIKNWGTKWNAYEITVKEPNVIEFETAWNGVIELIEKLSLLFPDVVFEYCYADEDTGYNCASGIVQNGKSNMYFPISESIDAYKIAFSLRPDKKEMYELVDGNYKYKEE